ncbi:hypothetical protein GCM10027289_27020 [Tsukamurella serpentis]
MSAGGVIDTVGDGVAGVPLAEAVVDAAEAVVADQSPMGLLTGAVAVGGEITSALEDPIGAFFGAGVGWILEHVPVLTSALDAVSGDPEAVDAVSETLAERVAAPLAGVGAAVRSAAADTSTGWTGVDADSYRRSTQNLSDHSDALATAARATAVGVAFAGSMVEEVRTFIRDELSKLVVWAGATFAAATAASVPTAGASVAGATDAILLRAAALGRRFATVLRTLSTRLGALGQRFAVLGRSVDALRRAGTSIDGVAATATRAVDDGAAVKTAFRLAADAPSIEPGEVAATAGMGAIKAAGDAWTSWKDSRPA